MNQASRVAVVTGAGRGLGAAIASDLHGRGHRVALLDLDGEAATSTAKALDATGESAIGLPVDVRDPAALRDAFDWVRSSLGTPEILVNNAGRTVPRPIWDIDLDEWDDVLTTNLRSVLIATRDSHPPCGTAAGGALSTWPPWRDSRAGSWPEPTMPPRRPACSSHEDFRQGAGGLGRHGERRGAGGDPYSRHGFHGPGAARTGRSPRSPSAGWAGPTRWPRRRLPVHRGSRLHHRGHRRHQRRRLHALKRLHLPAQHF